MDAYDFEELGHAIRQSYREIKVVEILPKFTNVTGTVGFHKFLMLIHILDSIVEYLFFVRFVKHVRVGFLQAPWHIVML